MVKNPPAMQEPQEKQVLSLGQEDPLEEVMATHFSILVRIIPWTEEPPPLQSMGSQKSWTRLRARAHTHTHTHTDSHTPPHRKLRSHMPCGVAKKKKEGYSKSL